MNALKCVLIGGIFGGIMTLILLLTSGWYSTAADLRTECEKDLPRSQRCSVQMIATPVTNEQES